MSKCLSDLGVMSLLLWLLLLLLRWFEWGEVTALLGLNDLSTEWRNEGMLTDGLMVLIAATIVLLPYLLLYRLKPVLGRFFVGLCFLLLLIASMGLTQFFLTTHVLLNSAVFEFSIDELLQTVGTEMDENRSTFLWGYLLLIPLALFLMYTTPKLLRKSKAAAAMAVLTMLGLFTSWLMFGELNKKSKDYPLDISFLLSNNKVAYLVQTTLKGKAENSRLALMEEVEVRKLILHFQERHPDWEFTNFSYPLVHSEPYENVLGDYFKKEDKAPNIVFVFCESLAGTISGKKAAVGNLTPFIDSLIDNGLYWENFLSNAERSYGVLPNVMGSLPYGLGPRGFTKTNPEGAPQSRNPLHQSLVSVLRPHGYKSGFFYGGWGLFDNMKTFLTRSVKTDWFVHGLDFNFAKYGTFEDHKLNQRWGYSDKVLFEQSLDMIDSLRVGTSPYLSFYLTLSFHSPFNMCPDQYHERDYQRERLKKIGYDRDKVIIGENVLASLLYADDSVRDFFRRYRKRKDFKNTIFVLTGDHGKKSGYRIDKLDQYHVPLVIYSPLLRKTGRFKGVSTHRDIGPSLLALLQDNFGLELPREKHWLGQGLDTSKVFRAERTSALTLFGNDFLNYLHNEYIVDNNRVFQLNDQLHLLRVEDEEKEAEILKIWEEEKGLNYYVCFKDRIWNPELNQDFIADSTATGKPLYAVPDNKLWAHRVNDSERAMGMLKEFPGIELDLVFEDSTKTLDVRHNKKDPLSGTNLDEYLEGISGEGYFWLDMKNLKEPNAPAIVERLLAVAEKHKAKDRMIVESFNAVALSKFAEAGFYTSFWAPTLQREDSLNKVKRIGQHLRNYGFNALSAPHQEMEDLHRHFPNATLHVWTNGLTTEEQKKLIRELAAEEQVRVILVDYPDNWLVKE